MYSLWRNLMMIECVYDIFEPHLFLHSFIWFILMSILRENTIFNKNLQPTANLYFERKIIDSRHPKSENFHRSWKIIINILNRVFPTPTLMIGNIFTHSNLLHSYNNWLLSNYRLRISLVCKAHAQLGLDRGYVEANLIVEV